MKKNYTSLTLIILTLCLYTLSGRGQSRLGGNINGTAPGEESGHSVSVSANGKIVAVGSDLYGTQKGRVRVYEYRGTAWTQLGQSLEGEADYDWSGHSVSLSADGKTVAIGAFGNNTSGNEATANVWDDFDGHVRVYTYNESTSLWTQLGPDIDGPNGKNDQLGYSVSLSADGRTVAIGSRLYDVTETTGTTTTTKTNAGRVQIYQWKTNASGSFEWQQLGPDINGEAAGDQLGYSVSLSPDGKTVAIGIPFHDVTETGTTKADAGQVQIHKYTASGGTGGTSWEKVGNYINGATAGEKAGSSVSLSADGEIVAIGAPGYNSAFASVILSKAGRVQVYKYTATSGGTGTIGTGTIGTGTTGTWTQAGSDVNSGGSQDELGKSVSLSADGKTVALGIEGHDLPNTNIGRTRVFQYSTTGTWRRRANIVGQAGGDHSGSSVSLSADGTTLATGSPKHNQGRGHVRVYEFFQITSPSTASVAENTANFKYTITAGGTPTFTLGTAKDGGLFELNGSEVSFKTPPDFENPTGINKSAATAEAKNVYEIQITATSGGQSITKEVTITVTNVVEAPVFSSLATANTPENTTATGYTAAATADATVTTGLTFSLVAGVKDNDLFAINSAGEITFETAPDYENAADTYADPSSTPAVAANDNKYEIQITATAGTGATAQTTTKDLTITVTNVVETPTFTSGSTAETPENSTATDYTAAVTFDATVTDPVVFSLDETVKDNGKFTVDATSGAISFKAAPDYENAGDTYNTGSATASDNVYELQITATAGTQPAVTHDVTITVTNVVEAPVFSSAATKEVAENTTATGYTAAATADATVTTAVSFSLAAGTKDNDLFEITLGAISFKAAPDYETPAGINKNAATAAEQNVYELQITANDGVRTSTKDILITVTNVVEAPVFSSLATANTPENTTGTGYTATTGTDTDAATFSLVAGVKDNDLFEITLGAISFKTAPDYENAADTYADPSSTPAVAANDNKYEIQITATAGTQTATHNVTITVTDVLEFSNTTFTASVAENATGTGTTTTDVVYTFTSATASVSYAAVPGFGDNDKFTIDGTTGEVKFVAVPDFENPADTYVNASDPTAVANDNVYHIQVSATATIDGTAQTETKDVTIMVTNVVEAPVFADGSPVPVGTPPTVEVAENIPTTTTVYTVSVSDASTKDAATFTLATPSTDATVTADDDNDKFTINPTTGTLTFNTPPDYEAPGSAAGSNVYNIQITATAGTGADEQTATHNLTITVTDIVDETPPVITSEPTANVSENTTGTTGTGTVYTATAMDDASAAAAITFSLESGVKDNDLFAITSSGAVSFNNSSDYENPVDADKNNDYELQITARDEVGNPVSKAVTIKVTNVVEVPVFSSAATASVVENTPISTAAYTAAVSDASTKDAVTFSLAPSTANDNAKFNINGSTGVVTFKAVPDYENPADKDGKNDYQIQITATAGSESVTKDVTITVTNVVEAPVFSSGPSASLAENSPITKAAYTAAVSDASTKDAVTFSLAASTANDNAKFNINGSTGVVTFKAVPDYENPADKDGKNDYQIQITATAGSESVTKDVTITVTNVVEAPVFSSGPSASLAENFPITKVVYTAAVSDASTKDVVTFSLVSTTNDNAKFNINGSTGVVTFKTSPDYENPVDKDGKNDYQIQITATASSESVTKDVTITVTNVVEATVFSSGATASVAENSPITKAVYTAAVSDASTKDAVTFSLVSTTNDNAKFTIDGSTGAVKFVAAPDYENAADKDGNNDYQIQITATAGTESVTKDVVIKVTNVVEAPVFSSGPSASLAENSPITKVVYTAAVSDASKKDAVTFSLAASTANDNAKFTIDGSTGAVKFVAAPDYENAADKDGKNDYQIQITATAGTGTSAKTVTKDVVIKVTDVAEQGTIVLPETLAFADTKVGETVSKVLTISNLGTATAPGGTGLKVTAITFPTGFTGDWQQGTIAAGGKKEINVSFKPTEAKDYAGTITVESDGSGRNTLTVSGKGILVTGITAKGGTSEPQSVFPGLSVFPNPAEDVLNIKLPNQSLPLSVSLTDVNGQIVYKQEAVTGAELSIDVSGYKSGVYVLVFSNGSKAEQRKVVIR